jgi:two-component system NtrC family sensor kinase
MTGERVLVVDDSLTVRMDLAGVFQSAGFAVTLCATAAAARAAIVEQAWQLIILDPLLPDGDGFDLLTEIRAAPSGAGTGVLMLSTRTELGDRIHDLRPDADGYVGKPYDAADLVACARDLLRRPAGGATRPTGPAPTPKRILAVDDSPTYLHKLDEVLRDDGYDVVLAQSGGEALDLVATQPVDCILLDLVMPTLGGQETCRRMKAVPAVREIPVIMLTALADQEAMIESLACGADDYVTKTADFEVLRARVRAQIRRRQFEDENRQIREELLRKDLEAAEARAAREIAEARAELADDLQQANDELEAFSYSVSHDLRAPLRNIAGFSTILLEDHLDRLDEDGQDMLRRICAATGRMNQLIDGLLELSHTTRSDLDREPVDMSLIAHLVAEELARQRPERPVTFMVQEGLSVSADRRLLRTLLDNLIGNAWKFTAHVPAPRIEVGSQPAADGTSYFVRDNGVGFDPQYAGRLFEPFQRLHSAADFPGTGIGLATVRRIVNRHGGRVWAESAPGQGTSLFFTIPGERNRADPLRSSPTDSRTREHGSCPGFPDTEVSVVR